MNWTDKAREIADRILERESRARRIPAACDRNALSRLLAESAVEGMKHECDNWLDNKTT